MYQSTSEQDLAPVVIINIVGPRPPAPRGEASDPSKPQATAEPSPAPSPAPKAGRLGSATSPAPPPADLEARVAAQEAELVALRQQVELKDQSLLYYYEYSKQCALQMQQLKEAAEQAQLERAQINTEFETFAGQATR